MASSVNRRAHSPDTMRTANSSTDFQDFSLSTIDFTSQRPSKRQKMEVSFTLYEVDGIKQARHRTFSHWSYPASFHSRMIEAGFFGCTIEDRVICIYCGLICQQWNIEIDDPCEVHKILSPNCVFTKSMSHWNSSQYNKIVPTLPRYINYVDPQKRLASFSTWSKHGFPSIDKLVDAGFFYDNCKITCFYCDGSFESWESNNHPIAEHVRRFPHCNYAEQLCGKELYHKIQRSMKYRPGNIQTSELRRDHHRSDIVDDNTLPTLVAARLDLPMSKSLLKEKKFTRSIIKRCWKDQLRLKNDDFIDGCDLRIACMIRQKQIDLIDKKKQNVIIPSITLKEIYEKKQIYVLNNSNQSYTDILESFEDELQKHKNTRQKLGTQFTEEKSITIEREQSLNNWSYIKPSRYDIIKGGWIMSDAEDYLICPHCHIQYYNWKSDDDLLLIHRYLSPLCPFILSSNPFNSNPIPIRKAEEQYTDEDIANAQSQPYNGLVQSRRDYMFLLSDRRTSFDRFPGGCPINADELAMFGFYYTNCGRFIKCFYCKRRVLVLTRRSQSNQSLKYLHLVSGCRYIQQMNDHDPQSSIQQDSNKCSWCMGEEKGLMTLPCRHLCLCKPCGQIKRLCPVCKEKVTEYVIIYRS